MALKMFASFRGYVLASLLLTTGVISHAIYMKRFFYRSVIYLSKSKLAIMAMGNMALVSVLLLWRLVQAVFLGPLRFREVERLHIRARDAIIECCFAISVFREDFDLRFVALVMTLLLLKSLHWLSKDRIEFLEEQPLSPVRTHLRLVGLMASLLATDIYLVRRFGTLTYRSEGATVYVLFAFEFTVLVIELFSDIVRYIFLVIDTSVDGHWEGKGMFSFYVELLSDLCQLTVYVLFFIYVQVFYSFPYHIIRELYVTFHKFQRRCSDFLRYRRVVATMNDIFADATEEELADGDRTCIICREEMQSAKKLACGHIFHARCLQSWLKRQLTCPTCRATIDVSGNGNQSNTNARNGANRAQNNPLLPNQANNNNNNANMNNNNLNNMRMPNNGAVPPNAQGQGVVNFGEAGARILNMANQWWNQVMNEAGQGVRARVAPEAGAGAPNAANQMGPGAQPGVARQYPAPNHGVPPNMYLRGPNAVAHMEFRARRRGAWPQPFQPYRQYQVLNPAHPHQQNYLHNLPPGQYAANVMNPYLPPQPNQQPVGNVPQTQQENQARTDGTQGGSQAVGPNRAEGVSQSQREAAPSGEANHGASSSEVPTGAASSSTGGVGSPATPATEAAQALPHGASTESSSSTTQRQASPPSIQPMGSSGQVRVDAIPLERLLAIQEQIEVLRNEVMELVLMATSSSDGAVTEDPGQDVSVSSPDDMSGQASETGEPRNDSSSNTEQAQENGNRDPQQEDNSEAATLRRRRMEFLQRQATR